MIRDYISFTPLSEGAIEGILESAPGSVSADELSEMLLGLCELSSDEVEVAVHLLSDALLIRVYDEGEYLFPSPVGLVDGWDFKRAVRLIAEYTVKEMIPLAFCEVSREDLAVLGEVFVSMDASAYEDDEDLFAVRVRNECMRLDDYPTCSGDRITLKRISTDSLHAYAALCRDEENNKFWGYDVSEDNLLDTDEYFLEVAEREFDIGIALTLGAYYGDDLVGEGVIYSFDYMGSASVAVRILPEYQRHGLGGETLSLLIGAARNMGLSELRGEVKLENERSMRMTSRYMNEYERDSDRAYYRLKL